MSMQYLGEAMKFFGCSVLWGILAAGSVIGVLDLIWRAVDLFGGYVVMAGLGVVAAIVGIIGHLIVKAVSSPGDA